VTWGTVKTKRSSLRADSSRSGAVAAPAGLDENANLIDEHDATPEEGTEEGLTKDRE